MNMPPIVSPEEWEAARQELLVKRRNSPGPAMRWRPNAAGCREWPWRRTIASKARADRGDEALGSTWSYLDLTALGRQEEWEDSPEGYPQTPPYGWWNPNPARGYRLAA